MSKFVRLEGVAIDSSKIVAPRTGNLIRFAPGAFEDFSNSSMAPWTPILVGHKRDVRLPRSMRVSWKPDPSGLGVSFEIDTTKPLGLEAILAVRHGFLRQLSIGFEYLASTWVRGVRVPYKYITRASISEVSLTNRPACKGTSIGITGEPPATTKTLPDHPYERQQLVAFLKHIGVDSAPTIPQWSTDIRKRIKRDAELRTTVRVNEVIRQISTLPPSTCGVYVMAAKPVTTTTVPVSQPARPVIVRP